MTGKFPLSHHLSAIVWPNRKVGGTLVFEQSPGKELSLNCSEWEDFVRLHAEINKDVHERWRNVQGEEDDNATLRWTGLPVKLGQTVDDLDPSLLFAIKTVTDLPIDATGSEIVAKLRSKIDERLKAFRIGDKRIAVRFYNHETEVHLFEYHPRTSAVITLLNINYVDWVEFYKHFSEIDSLMQKESKGRRRPGVASSP